jgi:hypothetical protein
MVRNLITRVVNVVGLGAAGVAGGLLTRYDPVAIFLVGGRVFGFWAGAWLGVAFAAFFFVTGRDRSLGRPLVLAVFSAATLYVSMGATLSILLSRSASGFLGERAFAFAFAAGGAVGGLVLSTATFLTYAKAERRLLWRIAACGVGGGLAGFLAHTINPIVLFSRDFNFDRGLLVWQSAIGLLFGLLWPIGEKASAISRGMDEDASPRQPVSRPDAIPDA